MTRLNVNDARCEALFVSGLQRSDVPTPEALAEVISRTRLRPACRAASGWPCPPRRLTRGSFTRGLGIQLK